MANKAISELPQAQNVNNQDLFVLEQSGIAKKLTAETFITEQGIIDALAEALDGHGGIQSVALSSISGRTRTYLITFTDETTTTFQVLDGTSIDRIVKTSTAGLTDTYTVFMSDGTTSFFQVTNGSKGDTGYPTDEQVATAVNTWLDNNVTPGTGAVLDRTLTMSNAAAPADLVGELKTTINDVESATVVYMEPTNLLHGTITNGYIINADGSVTTRSEYSYSDYIEIDNSKEYIAFTRQASGTTRTMDGMTTAFYDENKTFISRLGGNVKTIPNNASYIRQNIVTTYLSVVYKPMIEYVNSTGSNIATVYSDWFDPYYALLANYGANFHNKKICVYGDSLAANGNGGDNAWINILANILDFDTAYNRGIGGSRITDTETRYAYVDASGDAYNRSSYATQQTVPTGYTEINPCMSLSERINTIPTDTDILIVLAGANDASGVTLDAIRTAYATMLDGIYARVPNARILLGTLLYNNNWDANANPQIVEKYNGIRAIVKDMGTLYGYPVIDFKGNMGVNKLNYSEYMDNDGVHYTTKTKGKNRIAETAIPNVFDIKYVT